MDHKKTHPGGRVIGFQSRKIVDKLGTCGMKVNVGILKKKENLVRTAGLFEVEASKPTTFLKINDQNI